MELRETILVMIALAVGVAASVMTSRFVAKSVSPFQDELIQFLKSLSETPSLSRDAESSEWSAEMNAAEGHSASPHAAKP